MTRREGLCQIICLRCHLKLGLYFLAEPQLCNVLSYTFYFIPFHSVYQRFQCTSTGYNLPHSTVFLLSYKFLTFQTNMYSNAALLPSTTENYSPAAQEGGHKHWAQERKSTLQMNIVKYLSISHVPMTLYPNPAIFFSFKAFTNIWDFIFICLIIICLFPLRRALWEQTWSCLR